MWKQLVKLKQNKSKQPPQRNRAQPTNKVDAASETEAEQEQAITTEKQSAQMHALETFQSQIASYY
jgi:hypothetical protein